MSVDELRRGFDRLSAAVVPVADPYRRLMSRARRRFRARLAKAGAGVVVASVAVAGVALQAGGGVPEPAGFLGWRVTSDWTWRLIDSPTRGDLAGDRELVDRSLARASASANPNLPHAKVLFAGAVAGGTLVLVARYSGTHAVLDVALDESDVSIAGNENDALTPVVTVDNVRFGDPARWTLVLAPAGCLIAEKTESEGLSTVGDDGWAVTDSSAPPVVSVVCDGTEILNGPTADLYSVDAGWPAGYVPTLAPAREGEPRRTLADRDLTAAARAAYRHLVAATHGPSGEQAIWTVAVPGEPHPREAALVVGEGGDRPVLLYIAGVTPEALLATERTRAVMPDEHPREARTGSDGWSLASTSSTQSLDLVAVRLPERVGVHAWLTDQVLVRTVAGAVRVEAVDGEGAVVASTPVDRGVAVLSLAQPAAVTLRAVDADDRVVAECLFDEPTSHVQLFGEEIIRRW